MRKINFLLVLIVVSLILLSAASIAFAQPPKKTLELAEVKTIYVNSCYTVMFKQTNKQEFVLEALPEFAELTEFKVENGIRMINLVRKP